MRKSRLVKGDPIFVYKIEHFVTCSVFSTALTDHFYTKSIDFKIDLSEKEANDILKFQLHIHGNQGEFYPGFFEASFEMGKAYNKIYGDASEWVIKNYPYLKK